MKYYLEAIGGGFWALAWFVWLLAWVCGICAEYFIWTLFKELGGK